MAIEDAIRVISERISNQENSMATEEAVKTAVVLPFLSALGYDVFDPQEVVPEFTADAVGKKGEKVDYAIHIDGEIKILIECKPITTELSKVHLAQLFRYFTVTSARFAILTNGRIFNFYTDIEAPNKLDDRPFLVINMENPKAIQLDELRKFHKEEFDDDGIFASAEKLKYTSSIKNEINKLIEDPSVSVRKHIESVESFVIQERRPDSRGGRRCGRTRIAGATTARSCAIRAT